MSGVRAVCLNHSRKSQQTRNPSLCTAPTPPHVLPPPMFEPLSQQIRNSALLRSRPYPVPTITCVLPRDRTSPARACSFGVAATAWYVRILLESGPTWVLLLL